MFDQAVMGRGPKDIHTHLVEDLLVFHAQGWFRSDSLRRRSIAVRS